jgi:hypothetical protein
MYQCIPAARAPVDSPSNEPLDAGLEGWSRVALNGHLDRPDPLRRIEGSELGHVLLCARQWCAVASVAVWSLYPVHVMPCARQWCAAASVAVWRACGMVARVHQALGPLGQKLRQMSVGGSVPNEDVCSRGVGAHTH